MTLSTKLHLVVASWWLVLPWAKHPGHTEAHPPHLGEAESFQPACAALGTAHPSQHCLEARRASASFPSEEGWEVGNEGVPSARVASRHWPCGGMPPVLKCAPDEKGPEPKYLGEGRGGVIFSGLDAQDDSDHPRTVIVKLIKHPEAPHLLLWREVMADNAVAQHAVEEARRECMVGKAVETEVKTGALPEAQRIRKCYGHNLDAGEPEDILYLKLEDAGNIVLGTLLPYLAQNKPQRGGRFVKVFKMIFEALYALHTLKWVMHDFHGSNVMMKEQNGDLFVKLIDFQSSLPAVQEFACDATTEGHFCNEFFAPPEYEGRGFHFEATCDRPGFDPKHPGAFDMYGVGLMFFDFLTKDSSAVHVYGQDMRRRFDLTKSAVDSFVRRFADTKVSHFWSQGFTYVAEDLKSMENSIEFLGECAKLISVDPAERPTAAQILGHPFMQAVSVPDEPDTLRTASGPNTRSSPIPATAQRVGS